MREHMGLYRGKRLDNDEWVEGNLIVRKDAKRKVFKAFIADESYEQISYEQRYIRSTLAPGLFRVDPNTVGECTGQPDKNGKLVFEGDILRVVSECCDYDYKTDVGRKYGYSSGLYVDGDFGGGDFTEIGFAFDYWSEEDAEVEIIGNIHDNPELLEVQNDD